MTTDKHFTWWMAGARHFEQAFLDGVYLVQLGRGQGVGDTFGSGMYWGYTEGLGDGCGKGDGYDDE